MTAAMGMRVVWLLAATRDIIDWEAVRMVPAEQVNLLICHDNYSDLVALHISRRSVLTSLSG